MNIIIQMMKKSQNGGNICHLYIRQTDRQTLSTIQNEN